MFRNLLKREKSSDSTRLGMPFDVLTEWCPETHNEDERMKTVKALGLANGAPSSDLDQLLNTMLETFQAPAGVISYFLGGRGYNVSSFNCARGDLEWRLATCYWMLLSPHRQALVVEDLSQDARFAHTAYAELGLKAYMACPLVASNGHRIGSICFIDYVARQFTLQHVRLLANFAELASRQIEQQLHLPERLPAEPQLQDAYALLSRSVDAAKRCVLLVDVSAPGCAVKYANPAWQQLTGVAPERVVGAPLASAFLPTDGGQHNFQSALQHMLASSSAFRLPEMQLAPELAASTPGGATTPPLHFHLTFRPVCTPHIDEQALLVNVPGYVPAPDDSSSISTSSSSTGSKLQHLYFVTITEASSSSSSSSSPEQAAEAPPGALGPSLASALIPGLSVQQLLGVGSHASVYKATWHGTPVAVKVMAPLAAGSAALRQALFEVHVAQRCAHPNIAATHTYALANQQQQQQQQGEAAVVHYTPADAPFHSCSSAGWHHHQQHHYAQPDSSQLASSGEQPPGSSSCKVWALLQLGDVSTEAATAQQHSSGSDHCAFIHYSPAPSAPHTSGEFDLGAASPLVPESQLALELSHLQLPGAQSTTSSGAMHGTPPAQEAALPSGQPPGCQPPPAMVSLLCVVELCDKGCLQDACDMGWLLTARHRATAQPALPAILHTALEVAAALRALHCQDVVHGDLSAYNVLLASDGAAALAGGRGWVAKVADFGMSHSLSATSYLRVNSYGTVTHMAPEVLLHGISSTAADVYSLGVLMWQMLTSSRPWAGLRHDQVVQAVARERCALSFPACVPPDVAALAGRCMAWEGAARPSAGDVEAVLRGLVGRYCPGALCEDF